MTPPTSSPPMTPEARAAARRVEPICKICDKAFAEHVKSGAHNFYADWTTPIARTLESYAAARVAQETAGLRAALSRSRPRPTRGRPRRARLARVNRRGMTGVPMRARVAITTRSGDARALASAPDGPAEARSKDPEARTARSQPVPPVCVSGRACDPTRLGAVGARGDGGGPRRGGAWDGGAGAPEAGELRQRGMSQ